MHQVDDIHWKILVLSPPPGSTFIAPISSTSGCKGTYWTPFIRCLVPRLAAEPGLGLKNLLK